VTIPSTAAPSATATGVKSRLLTAQILAGLSLALSPAAFYSGWEFVQSFALNPAGLETMTAIASVLLVAVWAVVPVGRVAKLKAAAFFAGALILALLAYPFISDGVSSAFGFMVLAPVTYALALAGWLVLRGRPGRSFGTLPIAILTGVAVFVRSGGSLSPALIGWAVVITVPAATAWIAYLVGRGDGGAQKRAAFAQAAQQRRTEATAQAIREWQAAYRLANPGLPVPLIPPGYQQTAPPADTDRLNTFAVLSLVFGILGGYLAIVFGFVAKSQIKRTGERGNGMATAGLILGFLWIGVTILLLVGVAISAAILRG
jgi:hypothetical protein